MSSQIFLKNQSYDNESSDDEIDCDEFDRSNNIVLIGTKLDLVEDRFQDR